ncbi:MAG: hypothetical protein M3416_03485 [Acidobacteriota bacterium]|nr:hypothetical protein [Acidobacteriota bacterium]
MSSVYAMRRANGDWFALDDGGRFRVPVFRSNHDGMAARACHRGMLLFKPVALDALALGDLTQTDGAAGAYFWLVDNPFTNLNRGRSINRAQLAALAQDAA